MFVCNSLLCFLSLCRSMPISRDEWCWKIIRVSTVNTSNRNFRRNDTSSKWKTVDFELTSISVWHVIRKIVAPSRMRKIQWQLLALCALFSFMNIHVSSLRFYRSFIYPYSCHRMARVSTHIACELPKIISPTFIKALLKTPFTEKARDRQQMTNYSKNNRCKVK